MGVTKWSGLWSQRQGVYASAVIKKADIPKHTRIIFRYNKYYEKDKNRPRFVFCFADSEGYEELCVPLEMQKPKPYKDSNGCYWTEEGERLYTRADARAIINGTVADVEYGITDPYDILPEDFA